jgi:sugar transferase (PEP-CTERM/EpsH1 system associated)
VRILFLTSRFPYPPLRGDQVRAYHQIRVLARRHAVTLLALTGRALAPGARAHMESLCERVIVEPLTVWRAARGLARLLAGDPRPVQTLLYIAAGQGPVADLVATERFDVIHAQLVRMAGLLPPRVGAPLVVDLVDCLSASYGRRRAAAGRWSPALTFEASRLGRYEQALLRNGPCCLVVSEAERQALAPGGAHAVVNPNGVDLGAFPFMPGQGAPGRLVFVGNLGYPPNAEGISWFVNEVLPRVQQKRPGSELVIVGPRAPRAVRRLGRRHGVRLAGTVPHVGATLADAGIAVAPLRSGGGIQNKVLEAMAAGTPVVATSQATSGVAVRAGEHCLVADTAAEFARAVEALLDSPELRLRLATAARALVTDRYSWERSVGELEGVYRSVIGDGAAKPPAGVEDYSSARAPVEPIRRSPNLLFVRRL